MNNVDEFKSKVFAVALTDSVHVTPAKEADHIVKVRNCCSIYILGRLIENFLSNKSQCWLCWSLFFGELHQNRPLRVFYFGHWCCDEVNYWMIWPSALLCLYKDSAWFLSISLTRLPNVFRLVWRKIVSTNQYTKLFFSWIRQYCKNSNN